MAFTDFATVLRSSRFRRLFAVRATGQLSDGLFQAALATFVLFSPERQASPQAIVTAFAILYLPYSFIGPFAGVFLDTWSRRQVLLYGNLIRAVIVVGICFLTAAGHSGMDLGIAVLVALGINRFILAGLSAALPHTVSRSTLVTANAFAPTAGTMCAAIGGLAGVVLRGAFGGGDRGSTVVLIIATVGFTLSGLLALRMAKGLLGPDGDTPRDTVMGVIRGLGDGAVTLWGQRPALRAITAVTMHRVAFGAATIMVILLLRNTLNPSDKPEAALSQLSLVIGGAAGGALVGALLTPRLTRLIGPIRWSSLTLAVAGILTPIALGVATVPVMIAGGAVLGFAGQCVKICADTSVQTRIHDDHRGRVFALYDVALNIGLVAGIAAVAYTSPASGECVPDLIAIAVLLVVTAVWYYSHRRDDSVPKDALAKLMPAAE